MKLTQDQHEALAELLENKDGMNVMFLMLESVVQRLERDVVAVPLSEATEKDVIYRKARAEGARRVQTELLAATKLKNS